MVLLVELLDRQYGIDLLAGLEWQQVYDRLAARAAAGLRQLQGTLQPAAPAASHLQQRFEFPTPRVELGVALRGLASACIDVSDGLCVDAQRLLNASGCGAVIELEQLPISWALREALGESAWRQAFEGGEDYELCFSAPPTRAAAIAALAQQTGVAITRIGRIVDGSAIELKLHNKVMQFSPLGFDHFRS